MPAVAGIQLFSRLDSEIAWIPASAGMTNHYFVSADRSGSYFTCKKPHSGSAGLLFFLGACAGPLGTIAIIADAGDSVAAIDVEDCAGYVTRPVGG
jgi:hypothetical protein